MSNPKPQFTKEEQKTLERMKRACEKDGAKPRRAQEYCAVLKAQQINEWERKEAELRSIAAANLSARRVRAITFVMAKMNAVQTEGLLLSNALQKASGEYDAILGARAKEPIAGEIAFTLFLTVLPELKIVGRALASFGSHARRTNWKEMKGIVSAAKATDWAEFADEIMKKTNPPLYQSARLKSFAQFLDNQSKDIIEAVKNPLGASANVDAETQKRLAAFSAKNQVLTDLIKSVEKKLVLITKFEPIFYAFILWYEGEDLLAFLEYSFRLLGFHENIAYDARSFDLFADLILYDMLRAYARRYAVAWINMVAAGRKFEDVIGKSYDIDGLDEAQRKMIYNKFGAKVWKSRAGYRTLDDSRDLIRHLGVRTISNLDDKEVDLFADSQNPFKF
jgi:hypothetical protein